MLHSDAKKRLFTALLVVVLSTLSCTTRNTKQLTLGWIKEQSNENSHSKATSALAKLLGCPSPCKRFDSTVQNLRSTSLRLDEQLHVNIMHFDNYESFARLFRNRKIDGLLKFSDWKNIPQSFKSMADIEYLSFPADESIVIFSNKPIIIDPMKFSEYSALIFKGHLKLHNSNEKTMKASESSSKNRFKNSYVSIEKSELLTQVTRLLQLARTQKEDAPMLKVENNETFWKNIGNNLEKYKAVSRIEYANSHSMIKPHAKLMHYKVLKFTSGVMLTQNSMRLLDL